MEIYLIDGTYELFRHYHALPSARDEEGREVAAVRGVLASLLGMIKGGATHVAVATDHVIESFRNELWPDYKTGEGIEPDLLAQFPLLEEVLSRLMMRLRLRHWPRPRIHMLIVWSFVRPIKIWPNACPARELSN